ncbi:DUF2530 domain-containing protein [Streptosporangium sp. NBC_01639]|uniref:DUF2530 domain-containing protein n=1 Tax=unclassified Streptosporangium TaxID=2632669 RepID=UPI002DD80E01|nr:DUF2530 domain-containing protein [Streptosporangium sp. NBC_01756]WSC89771.1 DUF2530 domain-containing protein [Streptosporangium sp. NBC_01756]WTD51602.1 DUF2530 domain-containing protein [Streptosporangium sp. NBC_01639]
MNQPRRPELRPLKTNNTATVLAGTVLWAVALLVLLIVQPDAEHQWWIWTCVSGICGGIFGLWFVRRHDRRGPPPGSEEQIEPITAVPPASSTPPAP